MKLVLRSFVFLLFLMEKIKGRKHHLRITEDPRRFIPISTFGFYSGGWLSVNMTEFRYTVVSQGNETNESHVREGNYDDDTDYVFGFSVDKTISGSAINPYYETLEDDVCILDKDNIGLRRTSQNEVEQEVEGIIKFVFDFRSGQTRVRCSDGVRSVEILANKTEFLETVWNKIENGKDNDVEKNRGEKDSLSDSNMFAKRKIKRNTLETFSRKMNIRETKSPLLKGNCQNVKLKLGSKRDSKGRIVYDTAFVIYINFEKDEGLYGLYFHNCGNYHRKRGGSYSLSSFTIDVEEKNHGSYLSAGEMPLPALYLLMAVLFFLSGCFWVFILRKNGSEQVFRIHWIMAALVYLKSLSLFFHGINYHKIETNGYHIESWAVLYYITHLLKGGLLFFTIVLIGSGWAFVKHILSDKEKRIFIVVLPLQVLANVAYIIVEESEEGEAIHNYWKDVFILVDLLCCGAILLPVVWSIRHLQDASGTDGKASISLEKLKLFKHFYIMVVCYVYFTRIIVFLLKITVPFKYEWLDETFREMATFVFFVMTGYKFRPASNNPYFSIPTDEYEIEEILVGKTAINERVINRNKASSKRLLIDTDDDSDDDEGMVFFPDSKKTESSHDLD